METLVALAVLLLVFSRVEARAPELQLPAQQAEAVAVAEVQATPVAETVADDNAALEVSDNPMTDGTGAVVATSMEAVTEAAGVVDLKAEPAVHAAGAMKCANSSWVPCGSAFCYDPSNTTACCYQSASTKKYFLGSICAQTSTGAANTARVCSRCCQAPYGRAGNQLCGTTTIRCMDSSFQCCYASQGYGNVYCKGSSPTQPKYTSGKCCNREMFSYTLCPSDTTCRDGVYGSALCTGCGAGYE